MVKQVSAGAFALLLSALFASQVMAAGLDVQQEVLARAQIDSLMWH